MIALQAQDVEMQEIERPTKRRLKCSSISYSRQLKRIDFLTSLPCEVVLQVMSWMDLTTLLGMASVSKRWYELSKTNDIWRRRLIEMHWLPIRPCSSFTRSIASCTTDWYYWYKQRYQLEKRWRSGNVTTHYLLGHQDSVYCLQFDASQIVTGGRDRTIRFWDMSTYTCTRTLIGHEGSVLALQYNDQLMVSSSSDTTVIVWCMKTFKPIQRLRGHAGGVLDVSFDDRYIVSCSKDKTIKIWETNTGQLVRTISAHRGPVNAVQLRGNKIVSASGDGLIKMWNVETGECIANLLVIIVV